MLEIQNVSKTFNAGTVNQKTALNGLNLKLNEGDFVTVIGGNGAGKSTMLNAVAGVWPVDEGKIIIDGVDVTRLSEHQRAAYIGRVFQDPMTGTAATMQIEENLALAARRGKPRTLRIGITKAEREQYRELLKTLDLGLENRLTARVGLLSGGQRQRIGIARALAVEPSLIIADEPVSALDVSIQAQVLNLLNELKHDLDLTYIFVAHDLSVVEYISDRVGVMYLGNFVEVGEKEKIYSNPMHPYTQALLSAVPVPDPTAKRERILLEGSIPSAHKPPTGCKFHTRCPKCMECCKTQAPERYEVDDGHYVYCHLYDKERREQQK